MAKDVEQFSKYLVLLIVTLGCDVPLVTVFSLKGKFGSDFECLLWSDSMDPPVSSNKTKTFL